MSLISKPAGNGCLSVTASINYLPCGQESPSAILLPVSICHSVAAESNFRFCCYRNPTQKNFLIQMSSPTPPVATHAAPIETLAGLVERVTYHNNETGFCVLRIKARGQRELVTVVGHAASISAGEWVQMSGIWVNDRVHGLQFKAAFLKASAPTTLEGIEKYLGSGMIRGIGPIYAKKLVHAFGEAVFELIEQEPGRLHEGSGIGPKRARRIIAGGADLQDVRAERGPTDQREPLPFGPRHSRYWLSDRRQGGGEARHREDGDDPGEGRGELRPGRGHGRRALRLTGRCAERCHRQADRGAAGADRHRT